MIWNQQLWPETDMCNLAVSTSPGDVLLPLGTRTSADTVIVTVICVPYIDDLVQDCSISIAGDTAVLY